MRRQVTKVDEGGVRAEARKGRRRVDEKWGASPRVELVNIVAERIQN